MNTKNKYSFILSLFNRRFDKLVESIKHEYDNVCAERDELRNRLASWKKDDELRALQSQVDFCRTHSLHALSDVEAERISLFRARHYENCKNAGTYLFELSGTGFGETISIQCPICGKKEDVTDTESW